MRRGLGGRGRVLCSKLSLIEFRESAINNKAAATSHLPLVYWIIPGCSHGGDELGRVDVQTGSHGLRQ